MHNCRGGGVSATESRETGLFPFSLPRSALQRAETELLLHPSFDEAGEGGKGGLGGGEILSLSSALVPEQINTYFERQVVNHMGDLGSEEREGPSCVGWLKPCARLSSDWGTPERPQKKDGRGVAK